MTQITLQIPQVGQSDSTEDPKVASDFTTIQAEINGQLDQSNIAVSAAFLALKPTAVSANMTAVTGTLYRVTATATITLPGHSAGQVVGVINVGGTTTVSGSSVQGVGLSSASSFTLGTAGAAVVLVDDGTNWNIVAGQQDTGWVALALLNGFSTASGYYAPAARLAGDQVRLRGVATTGTAASNIANIPSAIPKPASNVLLTPNAPNAALTGSFTTIMQISTGGVISFLNGNQAGVSFDGLGYAVS